MTTIASEREVTMLMFILGILILGLIAGFIARALVPGDDSMGIGATIALGIIGSLVGGFLADVLFRSDTEDRGLNGAASSVRSSVR